MTSDDLVCHAACFALLELRSPPTCGLVPLLAALLPLSLSSYPALRQRIMDAAATLVGRQAAWLQAGEPLPEAPRAVDRELHAAGCSSRAVGAAKGSSAFLPIAQLSDGMTSAIRMTSAWHAIAASKLRSPSFGQEPLATNEPTAPPPSEAAPAHPTHTAEESRTAHALDAGAPSFPSSGGSMDGAGLSGELSASRIRLIASLIRLIASLIRLIASLLRLIASLIRLIASLIRYGAESGVK